MAADLGARFFLIACITSCWFSLRRNLSLREVSRGMRDAFDEHITAFDFQGFTMAGVAIAIERMLPRCPMLSSLCCTREATDREFAQHWKVFFEGRRGNSSRIRVLRFLDTAQFSSVPETIAAGCGTSVEELQVMSFEPHMTTSVLSSVAQHCPGVKSIDALLDGVDCRVLAGFSSLRTLRAVFRNELSMHESIGMLIWALGQGGSGLECVELRVHNNIGPGSSSLARLPEIPRLRKLSLFSSTPPIVPWLTGCEYLEKLQFEWVAELTDRVVVEVASFLGKRLKELRIWHCALLTDATLRAIAFNCSNAHVELKFDTGQFSVECVDALVSVEFEVSEVSP